MLIGTNATHLSSLTTSEDWIKPGKGVTFSPGDSMWWWVCMWTHLPAPPTPWLPSFLVAKSWNWAFLCYYVLLWRLKLGGPWMANHSLPFPTHSVDKVPWSSNPPYHSDQAQCLLIPQWDASVPCLPVVLLRQESHRSTETRDRITHLPQQSLPSTALLFHSVLTRTIQVACSVLPATPWLCVYH